LRLIEILLAQTTQPVAAPSTQGQPPPPLFQILGSPLFLVALMLAALWIFTSGGKRKEERKRQDMLKQLKKGDRIQTIGGVLGTVVDARDNEVVVKVDESSNTKVRFARSAIHRVMEEEKSESK
jgi:preprotein translocase subunit YajC